ncbi:uncharacterized protein LOC142225202 [Haematobia irritans]|uniref:uncharacterized protein LOC142225202 n=1 Tax=Haematobia irritans TaxID=7368 RepID=UPI003F507FF1
MDEFRYVFINSDVDVICVSETWFHPKICDDIYSLEGYSLHRSDRLSNAGGVAIYVRSTLICNIKLRSASDRPIEYIFAELCTHTNFRILIGCIYRPNDRIAFEHVMQVLENISLSYDDIILLGDLNSNLLQSNTLTQNLQTFDFHPVNTETPTHFTSTSATLLDVIFVNQKSKILLYDQLCAPGFSKHDLLFITYDIAIENTESYVTFRDFKNLDYRLLNQYIESVHWTRIYDFVDVNKQLTFIQENLNAIYDTCVPVKTIRIQNKQPPWFNNEIKHQIVTRDLAYKRWKRFKTPYLYEMYKSARRVVVKTIENAKSNYYSQKFKTALDSKSKWKEIRNIGIGNKKTNVSNEIDVNKLNETFSTINTAEPLRNMYSEIDFVQPENTFSFRCVDKNEVLKSFYSIKSNATGVDELSPKFLKIVLPQLLPFFTYLLNTCLTKSTFPTEWKVAKIIPLPKAKNEFRPIAILPFLSKVLERIMNEQIIKYLDNFKLLSEKQSGFRKQRNCISALTEVIETIRQRLDEKMVSFLVLLDHSKAFDTVDHKMLLSKLEKLFFFSENACKLISSYLKSRSQIVFLNNKRSIPNKISRGVPQGSILGPILFTIYINDLTEIPQTCNLHMYADDVQVYTSAHIHTIESCINDINSDLNLIQNWARNNGLHLNPSKTKYLAIAKNKTVEIESISTKLCIENVAIDFVQSHKNLGIIFNSKLTWSDHILSAVGNVHGMLRNLWAVRTSTPQPIRMLLAKTFLIPKLLYGCEIFASSNYSDSQKLKIAYNNIARYIFNKRRYDRISEYAYKIFNIKFENLLKVKCLVQLHKIVYTKSPPNLYSCIQFARSNRGLKIIHPMIRSLVSERQFFIYTIRLWNSLPFKLQTTSNAIRFKNELFKIFS